MPLKVFHHQYLDSDRQATRICPMLTVEGARISMLACPCTVPGRGEGTIAASSFDLPPNREGVAHLFGYVAYQPTASAPATVKWYIVTAGRPALDPTWKHVHLLVRCLNIPQNASNFDALQVDCWVLSPDPSLTVLT